MINTKQKVRVWLVHGFNVKDEGARSVSKLAKYFEEAGYQPKLFRYGWTGLLGVRFFDKRFAQLLKDAAETGDYVVGHSNGCCIAHLATQMGAPFTRMVYINPALNRDAPLAKQVGYLDVWHSPSDQPVKWSRLLPFHRWGDMGAVGYCGKYDPRIRNFDKEHNFKISSSTHSDIFEPHKLSFFAPLIINCLTHEN